jgi:DNA polymerase elongation subunit (family B)
MNKPKGPRILLLDIETFPNLVWVWRLWKTDAIDVVDPVTIAGFSAEWVGGGHKTFILPDVGNSETALLNELWLLLDDADVVIAHNAKGFDIKVINSRFLANNFKPPSPYQVIDTLREIKRIATFPSHKLDYLSRQFGVGSKLKHEGFEMWKGCMRGEKKWWEKMRKYNRHDIILLKKLYQKIAPWITTPNANTFSDDGVCPNINCGSKNIHHRGVARTKTRLYQRYQCKDCGAWGRSTLSDPHKKATIVSA